MVALWREALRKTTLVVAPMFTFLMVEAADLIHVVYGPRYSESSSIFRIYLLFLPLRIATWGLIPQAVGRTRINLTAGWIILPTNVIVAVGLVGPLGLKGPAFAAPAAALLATLYYLVRIRTILSTPIRAAASAAHGILCFAVSAFTGRRNRTLAVARYAGLGPFGRQLLCVYPMHCVRAPSSSPDER